jgi:uncharacterized membrane protein
MQYIIGLIIIVIIIFLFVILAGNTSKFNQYIDIFILFLILMLSFVFMFIMCFTPKHYKLCDI